jgi:hypothetical protein
VYGKISISKGLSFVVEIAKTFPDKDWIYKDVKA